MPDSRLPDHWLGDPKFDGISAEAWRIFTHGYMWSNRYLTDGKIPLRSLRHLGTETGSEALGELLKEGLLTMDSEAIYLDWTHQTHSVDFKAKREEIRLKAAKHRASQKELTCIPKDSNQVRNPLHDQLRRRGEAEESDEFIAYLEVEENLF